MPNFGGKIQNEGQSCNELTGPWSSRFGLPTRQSKTTLEPACAQISVLFLPMKICLPCSWSFMKSTGSTIDSFVESSFGLPYNRSIPEENTEIGKKKEISSVGKNTDWKIQSKSACYKCFISENKNDVIGKAIPKSIFLPFLRQYFFSRTDECDKIFVCYTPQFCWPNCIFYGQKKDIFFTCVIIVKMF